MTRRCTLAILNTAAIGILLITGIAVVPVGPAAAHGAPQDPAARTYSCRFAHRDNAMCDRAWDANPQALYDWPEVNIGNADGRHRQLIPDGRLCSAGRDKYSAFDEPGQWPVTHMTPGSGGAHQFVYKATAPHATAYYRVYLTGTGFDARTDRLDWSDLTLVYDSGPSPAQPEVRFTVSLPDRDKPAILYVIWQRSDSQEAFYSCSDVTIGAEAPVLTPPTTQPPPPPTTTPPAPSGAVDVAHSITSSWSTGQCVEAVITNGSAERVEWSARLPVTGPVTSIWDGRIKGEPVANQATFVGAAWNRSIDPGQTITFGYCTANEAMPT